MYFYGKWNDLESVYCHDKKKMDSTECQSNVWRKNWTFKTNIYVGSMYPTISTNIYLGSMF